VRGILRSSAAGSENNVMIGSKKKPSRNPSPPGSGKKLTKANKDAAAVAAASSAIEKTHTETLASRKMAQLQDLRSKIKLAEVKLKRKSYRGMDKEDPNRAAKKARFKVLQKNCTDWQNVYNKLTKELGYESPVVDMSDSSEEEVDGNNTGNNATSNSGNGNNAGKDGTSNGIPAGFC